MLGRLLLSTDSMLRLQRGYLGIMSLLHLLHLFLHLFNKFHKVVLVPYVSYGQHWVFSFVLGSHGKHQNVLICGVEIISSYTIYLLTPSLSHSLVLNFPCTIRSYQVSVTKDTLKLMSMFI